MFEKKILLIEGNKVNRDHIQASLNNAGFTVIPALNSDNAFDLIQSESFDLIMSDFASTDPDGFQFSKKIRENQRSVKTPIILVISKEEKITEKIPEKIENLEFFSKPYEDLELIFRVKKILSISLEKKILVIDDSNAVKKFIQNILSGKGYQIVTASDGLEALEKVKKYIFDLIIVDFIMPRMDGFQFCKELKKDDQQKNIPILLVSSKGDKIGDKFMNILGINSFLTKPFSQEELINAVNEFWKKEIGYSSPTPIGHEKDQSIENIVERILKSWEKEIFEKIIKREENIMKEIEQVSLTLNNHLLK